MAVRSFGEHQGSVGCGVPHYGQYQLSVSSTKQYHHLKSPFLSTGIGHVYFHLEAWSTLGSCLEISNFILRVGLQRNVS